MNPFLREALSNILANPTVMQALLKQIPGWLRTNYDPLLRHPLMEDLLRDADKAVHSTTSGMREGVLERIWQLRLATHEAGHAVFNIRRIPSTHLELCGFYIVDPNEPNIQGGHAYIHSYSHYGMSEALEDPEKRTLLMAWVLAGPAAEPPIAIRVGTRSLTIGGQLKDHPGDVTSFEEYGDHFAQEYSDDWSKGGDLYRAAQHAATDPINQRAILDVAYRFYEEIRAPRTNYPTDTPIVSAKEIQQLVPGPQPTWPDTQKHPPE